MTDIVTLPAGTRGVDYSSARPDLTALYNAGHRFVVRYIAHGPPRPKVVTAAEIADIHAHGLGVLLVWETTVLRPLAGRTAGLEDGAAARRMLVDVGYPTQLAVIVAVDTDTTPATAGVIERYVRGFEENVRWQLRVYGDDDIIHLTTDICEPGWLAAASAWSTPVNLSHVGIRQHAQDPSHQFDPNTALRAIDVWLPGQHPPTTEETDMQQVVTNEAAYILPGQPGPNVDGSWPGGHVKWAMMPDGTKRHISPAEHEALGQPTGRSLPNTTLSAITDWQPAAVTGSFSISGSGTVR